MNATNRTVVVTGIGATTPLGGDTATTWQALVSGESGVRELTEDWVEGLPVRIAATAAKEPAELLPRPQLRKLDRAAQFALLAAREAWADAGFTGRAGEDAAVAPDRLGAVIASGIGGVTTLMDQYDVLKEKGPRKVSPHTVPMLMPNSPAANVGLEIGATSGVHTPVSACASGAEAVGYAAEMIRTGRADVVVAGGTEACIHPLPIAAFANMMALSKNDGGGDPRRVSRPYDRARDGFVLGEGCGVVVLEAAEHAAARGARVYCEMLGQGISADSHHIAQPEPTGRGIAEAVRHVLEQTDLKAEQLTHVNAHATSTPLGDVAEIKALRQVLGDDLDHVAISATKSMTGHLLGGAGGVETVATVLALHHRTAPPTINVDELDPEVDADIVRGEPRQLPSGTIAAVNNSFGFGGHNIVLAFRTV